MPRQQLYRVLSTWLSLNRDRFYIHPTIGRSSRNCAEIKFPGLAREIRTTLSSARFLGWSTSKIRNHHVNPYLTGFPSGSKWVGTQNLNVVVDHQGITWDILADFDVQEIRQPNGYVCGFCLPEFRKLYPTRESLWINELFEPLLAWVNGKLAPASSLILSAHFDSSWADLVKQIDLCQSESKSTYVKTIPLRQNILA